MRNHALIVPVLLLLAFQAICADDSDDPKKVKRIPPPGVAVKPADREELEHGVDELGKEIIDLKSMLKGKPQMLDLIPDVQIYLNAVQYALKYDEFFNEKEIPAAKTLLAQGIERAQALRHGTSPWTTASGNIARGYVSKIDGSVQPYGLVVPASFNANSAYPHRLDLWYHGRGETLSELSFILGRQSSAGEFAPKDAFVLHPYGRYCNANKFAGETDTFEALEHVKKHYHIDENRISVRGFSMGGAACWQFAAHFAGLWAAAAPGAGFTETPEFTGAFKSAVKPTDFEQKLWHIYDAADYAENLFNLPTVAYSGELDGQKQAADVMARALKKVGIDMTHIIGPGVKHQYEPGAKAEVSRRVNSIVAHGRNPVPEHVKLVTYTLRYNEMFWLTIDGLTQHWEPARVDAKFAGNEITASTSNVAEVTFSFAPGTGPFEVTAKPKIRIDNQEIEAPSPGSDRSWKASLTLTGRTWKLREEAPAAGLKKRHGLQGPIDDAFIDSFVMVAPTGQSLNEKVGGWVKDEMAHAMNTGRGQYRGDARVVKDDAVTDEQIKNSNLVLWGDPSSNKVLAKIADKLPIKWTDKGIVVGNETYTPDKNIPLLIYPNPLNPSRYIVLNSGFTFRENEYLNNAKQNAKLPDWAVIDISEPPTSKWPGKVLKADFFDEQWELKK